MVVYNVGGGLLTSLWMVLSRFLSNLKMAIRSAAMSLLDLYSQHSAGQYSRKPECAK